MEPAEELRREAHVRRNGCGRQMKAAMPQRERTPRNEDDDHHRGDTHDPERLRELPRQLPGPAPVGKRADEDPQHRGRSVAALGGLARHQADRPGRRRHRSRLARPARPFRIADPLQALVVVADRVRQEGGEPAADRAARLVQLRGGIDHDRRSITSGIEDIKISIAIGFQKDADAIAAVKDM